MKKVFICCFATILATSSVVAQPQLTPKNIEKVIKAMTIEEKAHIVIGAAHVARDKELAGEVGFTRKIIPGAAGVTCPISRLGIPSIVVADGPAGLRISPTREGDSQTYYCTGFPVGIHLASTWNDEIIYNVGSAIGQEVKEYGVDILLAPGVNIMRNPLCGRNFEYYSEDPLLAGKTAAAMINGVPRRRYIAKTLRRKQSGDKPIGKRLACVDACSARNISAQLRNSRQRVATLDNYDRLQLRKWSPRFGGSRSFGDYSA